MSDVILFNVKPDRLIKIQNCFNHRVTLDNHKLIQVSRKTNLSLWISDDSCEIQIILFLIN